MKEILNNNKVCYNGEEGLLGEIVEERTALPNKMGLVTTHHNVN
jgi:hypothetical protein